MDNGLRIKSNDQWLMSRVKLTVRCSEIYLSVVNNNIKKRESHYQSSSRRKILK